MRVVLFCLSVALLCLAPLDMAAKQEGPRSPRNANYVLSARLDAAARTITGEGRLTWRNVTATPATELRFHLYWNAWRNDESTWMRERQLEGDTGVAARTRVDPASLDLTALRIVRPDGPLDVLNRLQFIAPDDGNTADRTLVSVPLDEPLPPAHDLTIEFAWTAQVPRPYDRTGVLGNVFFIAQWFPKIGVLQGEGWRAAQFHAHAEFFADFGTYDVSLTVPSGWIVGATGRETSQVDRGDGTATHRYIAQDVHDFAWTTAPDYIEHRDRFEAPGLAPVDIRLLLRPVHAEQAQRHLTAARQGLMHFGQRLGPFPWPNLTIVDPVTLLNPRVQGASTGGMEYPTLITAGTDWFSRWADDTIEDIVIHEVGHQYLQSAAANDETRDGWIDEGLVTFMTGDILEEAYPHRFAAIDRYFGGLVTWRHPDVPWSRLHQAYAMAAYRDTPGWDASTAPTWQMVPNTWAHTLYARTPLALETLRRTIGRDAMTQVLATFYARGKFAHPTTDDFVSQAGSAANRDLSWFFDATLQRPAAFDYAVGDVSSVPVGGDIGKYESLVIVQRLANGVFPIEIRVTFDDGTSVLERWNDETRAGWRAFRYERAGRVSAVDVDPDRVLVLDVHRTNNSWRAAPQADRAADRWTRRWVAWLQHVLMTYAFFA